MYERSRPSESQIYRDAAFLALATPAEVTQWLANRRVTYSLIKGTPETPPEAPVLEYILLRRNEPLIDLALAEHGRSKTVLERVFRRSSISIRTVACSNPSLFVGTAKGRYILLPEDEPLFWEIVEKGSLAELRALCENPNLSRGMYAKLITSWSGQAENHDEKNRLSDERFQQVLLFLSSNPRLGIDRRDSKEKYFLDGYAEYQYDILFSECWKLAYIVPVNQKWANCLSRIYERMQTAYNPYKDIEKILERWKPISENRYCDTKFLREILAKHYLEPTKKNLKHEDEAIRRAFYQTFDPSDEDFIEQDWELWCERDEHCEDLIQLNKNIWRNARGRAKLRNLLWDLSRENFDISKVGFFDMDENTYRKEHPEWFADEENFESKFDKEWAVQESAEAVKTANLFYGAKTYEAEVSINENLGKQIMCIRPVFPLNGSVRNATAR